MQFNERQMHGISPQKLQRLFKNAFTYTYMYINEHFMEHLMSQPLKDLLCAEQRTSLQSNSV